MGELEKENSFLKEKIVFIENKKEYNQEESHSTRTLREENIRIKEENAYLRNQLHDFSEIQERLELSKRQREVDQKAYELVLEQLKRKTDVPFKVIK